MRLLSLFSFGRMWQFAKEDNFLLRRVPWVPNGTIQRRRSVHFIFILFFSYLRLQLPPPIHRLHNSEGKGIPVPFFTASQTAVWEGKTSWRLLLPQLHSPPKKCHTPEFSGRFLKLYLLMFVGGACICHVSLEHPALKVSVHHSPSLTPNGDSLSSRAPSLPLWMVSLDPEGWPYLETIPKSGCLNCLKYDLWQRSL